MARVVPLVLVSLLAGATAFRTPAAGEGRAPVAGETPVLASLQLSKPKVTGCLTVTGTLTLSEPAPPGGIVVALSSDSTRATVPSTVGIKAGAVRKTFPVTTRAVGVPEPVRVTATLGGTGLTASIVLEPMGPKAITLSPASVAGGAPVVGTAVLQCPAGPGDIVVTLTSNKPAVATPGMPVVTVEGGALSAAFEVTTMSVPSTTKAVITASANGVTRSRTLTLTPPMAFEEVAERAGIVWSGKAGHEAFSVAWTDFNGDGLPDLWSLPHGTNYNGSRYPLLYLNQGDGTFVNRFERIWLLDNGGDTHGSSWADVDNDGDADVFVSVGAHQGTGTGDKLLYVNEGGILREQAALRGLDYPLGRGRGSQWFDWNRDGLLDLLQGVAPRPDGLAPTGLFVQTPSGSFEDRTAFAGPIGDDEARIVQLADLSGDGRLDVVVCESCAVSQAHTPPSHVRIFDGAASGLHEISDLVLPAVAAEPKYTRDVAIADVNNDLHPDILLSRSTTGYPGSTIFQGSETLASADLIVRAREVGIAFRTAGAVYVDLIGSVGTVLPPARVFIGASGRHPAAIGFTLRPDDPGVAGISPHVAGVDRGLFIGYDAATLRWEARFSSPGDDDLVRLMLSTAAPLTGLAPIGFTPADVYRNALSPILLVFDPVAARYVERTAGSGLETPLLGQSVVVGDFDNDMDVDLYVSGEYRSFHAGNVLYANRGDGTFTAVPDAAGARGRAVGPCAMENGLAARLAVADYDVDGFLDIFSGTTNAVTPTRTFLGEPPQLFRNLGNGNHWLEIDLEGTQSNRDGIGARVLATAGGVTQLREQGGGMHHFAQDHMRLHFGLAANRRVQRLEVRWPSGVTQVLTDVAADQVLRVVEPAAAPSPAP